MTKNFKILNKVRIDETLLPNKPYLSKTVRPSTLKISAKKVIMVSKFIL